MAGPSLKVIAFDATKAGVIPTVFIQASHTESGDGGTNDKRKKEVMQHTGAVPAGNPVKTVMSAAAKTPSIKTVVIPGYSGPA
jgi:hypothetical protein